MRFHLVMVVTLAVSAGCPDPQLWDETDTPGRTPDLDPPRVTAVSLGPLAPPSPPTGVSVQPTIEVTLSERLDPATVNPVAVSVKESAGPIESQVALTGNVLSIQPRAPLRPLTEHRLVLSATLRDLHGAPLSDAAGVAAPFDYVFVTGDESSGPPRAALISPSNGDASVPQNLREVLVSFNELVWGTLRCGGMSARCDGAAQCVIAMEGLLRPDSDYSIDVREIRDRDGSPASGTLGFRTGHTLDDEPPEILLPSCSGTETVLGSSCASVRDVRIALRFLTAEPARASARAGSVHAEESGPSLEHRLVLSHLAPNTSYEVEFGAEDAAGNSTSHLGLELETMPPLPSLVISEVYADAAGAEPAQEFIEIHNVGIGDIVLDGFVIADSAGPGGAVGGGATLPPGRYALIVSDRFDPASSADPPVAPDAVIARVAGALGTNGLLNAGEPVAIMSPDGIEVSRYPNVLAPRSGVSIERSSDIEADEHDPVTWFYNGEGSASPGAPSRPPGP